MTIQFIPNDPLAAAPAPAIRQQAKHANRPASRSSFAMTGTMVEGVADPGTPKFLYWQCREAALQALDAWENSAGAHTKWQGQRSSLALKQDAGDDLNAFYDRSSVSFFHSTVKGKVYYSGASTDVVSHEVGHALLDSVRADLWDANFLEAGALHEAFGDCMALLTALRDPDICAKLLTAAPNLRKANFVESTAEELSFAIRQLQPTSNAAEPRHAFNSFKYQLPSTLPGNGGPGKLINEVHSFGMLFTGCFWELLANLYNAGNAKTAAGLAAAAKATGALLIAGVKVATLTPRFLQSVGRGMVLADQSLNAGANGALIRDAFSRHAILLGSNAMLAPTMALAGAAPVGASISTALRADLRSRVGGRAGARIATAQADVFGTAVTRATHVRDVDLGAVSQALEGVVAYGHEPMTIGDSGGRAALLGAMPNAADTEGEVLSFVRSLLDHDMIELPSGAAPRRGRAKVKLTTSSAARPMMPSHAVASVAGRKVLKRVRFVCFCCR